MFNIDASSGVVTFKTSPNYEAPSDSNADNVYLIVVRASDGSLYAEKTVSITVTNVNESPTITSSAAASVSENISTSTTVYTVTATDVDANTTFTYSISGGYDKSLFNIDASSGVVTFKTSPNYENPYDHNGDNVYIINVSASDGTLYAEKTVQITVTNVNELATITGTASGTISETNSVQSVSSSLSVSDPDAGQSYFVAQTDVSGNNNYGSFSIDASGNWSYTMSSPHNELSAGQSYTDSITVSSFDGTATQVIYVYITGTNDAATIGGFSTGEITQTGVAQTVTGVLSISDPDAGQSSFVAQTGVAGNNNYGTFSIDVSGNWAYAMNSAHKEFAASKTYTDTITVTSIDGTTQLITVTMAGANDAPTITSGSDSSVTTVEAATSTAYTVTATDPDENAVLTYSISGGKNASLCNIDSSTGAVTFKSTPAVGVYNITVKVTDEHSAYSEKDVTIVVTSVAASGFKSVSGTAETITEPAVIVGTVSVSNLTSSANVEVPSGSTLTVASGTYTGVLSGNGNLSVADLDLKDADLSTFTGEIQVSGTLHITTSAGTLITLTNNGGDTTVSVVINSTDATTISTDLFASTDGTIENSNTTSAVSFSGTLYKPGTTFTLAGLIEIVGKISGTVPGSDTSTSNSDIVIASNANVVYSNTAADAYLYDGATTVVSGSTLTLQNGASLPNSSVTVQSGATLVLDYTGSTISANVVNNLTGNGSIAVNIPSDLAQGAYDVLTINVKSLKVLGQTNVYTSTVVNYTGINNVAFSYDNYHNKYTVTVSPGQVELNAMDAATAENSAASYQNDASGYETTAINSASSASSSTTTAQNASIAAAAAETAATAAETAATAAEAAATAAEAAAAEALTLSQSYQGNFAIGQYYRNARDSATNARTYASNARASASNARDFATNARASANAKNTPSVPTSNVCFPAKTPVLTNQGYVNIEQIDPKVHTIRNKKIVAITKTVSCDKNLVCIAKNALGKNYPEQTTFISQNHKVLFQGQMIKAKHLVELAENVTFVPYKGEALYNVLLEEHEKMQVNNLIVETLHPEHKVAKLYRFLKNVKPSQHGEFIAMFNERDREQRRCI